MGAATGERLKCWTFVLLVITQVASYRRIRWLQSTCNRPVVSLTPRLGRLGSNSFPLQFSTLRGLTDSLCDSHLTIVVGGAKQDSLGLPVREGLNPEPKPASHRRSILRPQIQSYRFHCDLAANNFQAENANSETRLPQSHSLIRLSWMRLSFILVFHLQITKLGSLRFGRL